jgi:pilus assembly protein CpaC
MAMGAVPCLANSSALPAESAAASIRTDVSSTAMHVLVGHSFFLTAEAGLKRIYISNPAVLDSLTSSPNELLVTAKQAGISSLVIWDGKGQSTVYTVSVDLPVDTLQESLHSVFPHQNIKVDAFQDRIDLSGRVATQADADLAVKLAQGFGKAVTSSIAVDPSPIKQVQLKVRFIEVDRVKLAQLAFNFLSLGKNVATIGTQQFTSFTGLAAGTATGNTATLSDPLNLLLYNTGLNVGESIQDLEQKQVVQILAEPTITALSGEEASFLSGGEFPFPVVQGGSGNYASVTVMFRPYGVKLSFTPTVNPDGTIRLKVAPEVSALDYTNEVQISGYEIPALSTRRAQTDVVLQSGQSFAISGLLDHRLTDQFSKMPGIANIPILGQLFRSKSVNVSVAELMVVVTPTLVDPLTTNTPIVEPKIAKPYLNTTQFDEQLKKKPVQ